MRHCKQRYSFVRPRYTLRYTLKLKDTEGPLLPKWPSLGHLSASLLQVEAVAVPRGPTNPYGCAFTLKETELLYEKGGSGCSFERSRSFQLLGKSGPGSCSCRTCCSRSGCCTHGGLGTPFAVCSICPCDDRRRRRPRGGSLWCPHLT